MVTGIQRLASFLIVMLLWTVLPGCSGDGSSDPTTVSQPPTQGGPSPTVGGNLPPTTGTFGDGQGKILFVEGGGSYGISEYDLATRQVQRLNHALEQVFGGVSRANDGTFAIVRNHGPGASMAILHHQADGTLLHKWSAPPQRTPGTEGQPNPFGLNDRPRNAFYEGGALSPDAKTIALAESTLLGKRLEVGILDVQSGTWVFKDLLGASDLPQDKSTLRASTFWSPTGELYVLSDVGLHRIDRTTGEGTLVHGVKLESPGAPVMSPDGRTIYFERFFGNSSGGTVWSMDVASGELTRRSIRSGDGKQFSPALSPDGQWLLMQEVGSGSYYIPPGPLNPVGAGGIQFVISAVWLSDPPIDTQNLNVWIRDSTGQPLMGHGRMVWY